MQINVQEHNKSLSSICYPTRGKFKIKLKLQPIREKDNCGQSCSSSRYPKCDLFWSYEQNYGKGRTSIINLKCQIFQIGKVEISRYFARNSTPLIHVLLKRVCIIWNLSKPLYIVISIHISRISTVMLSNYYRVPTKILNRSKLRK